MARPKKDLGIDEKGYKVLVFVHPKGTPRTTTKRKPEDLGLKTLDLWCKPWDRTESIPGTGKAPMVKGEQWRKLTPGDGMVVCEETYEYMKEHTNLFDDTRIKVMDINIEKYPNTREGQVIKQYWPIPPEHDIPGEPEVVPQSEISIISR